MSNGLDFDLSGSTTATKDTGLDFDLSQPSTNQSSDVARQTFIQNHPDGPVEASAALQVADLLNPLMHPTITATHPGAVAQSLYGKAMPATGLLDRLKNTWTSGAVENRLNDISFMRKNGKSTPALDA